MVAFERLFRESKGQPVCYKNQLIQMADYLPIESVACIRICIESTDSEWKQGIGLDCDSFFEIENERLGKKIAIWEDTAPGEVTLNISRPCKKCFIRNLWDTGNGVIESWHNGAAMIVEEIENGRRYRCNDGHPDDDFDDIIFTIEFLD